MVIGSQKNPWTTKYKTRIRIYYYRNAIYMQQMKFLRENVSRKQTNFGKVYMNLLSTYQWGVLQIAEDSFVIVEAKADFNLILFLPACNLQD